MIDGRWVTGDFPIDAEGRFKRAPTRFRGRLSAEPDAEHPAVAGRYHLYVSHACPWAHRVLIARALYGLEDAISVTSVDPYMGEDGWVFRDSDPDPLGRRLLREVYAAADPQFTGRVTVPVLWDRERGTIVNNESRELLRMFGTTLRALGRGTVDLCPEALRPRIDATIDANYGPINDGVYRSGFARSQAAYEAAVTALFEALDAQEAVLSRSRYLLGDALTEADICLFTTLLRFDPVYHGHFKCNLRRIVDYPNLSGYLRDVYQQPGVAGTCRIDDIKQHYYRSHDKVNPSGVVPLGPVLTLDAPHDRARLGGR
jgi:putative glutathione S-transferase